MADYEVPSGIPGRRNYRVPVPGTDVTASLGVRDVTPDHWAYSLWDGSSTLLSTGWLDLSGLDVTAYQVAHIAFLLDIEYETE